MELILWSVVLVVSLTLLVKSSDYFTQSAETIGLYLGMPKFIIGVTVVAIGTSLPELISSIFSVLNGASEFVAAQVVGSNIANIFLILGVTSIIKKKIKISYDLLHVDIPLFIGAAAYMAIASIDGNFTFGEGLLALACLLVYFSYAIGTKKESRNLTKQINEELKDESNIAKLMEKKNVHIEYFTFIILIASLFIIFISASFTVDSVMNIARILDVGTDLLTITVVALGTSLPELAVSLSAIRQNKSELVIGNILGSNIFNSLGVMGVASFFGTLTVSTTLIMFGIPVMIIATLLYFFKISEKEITLWEGWMLVIFYFFFIGKTINII